MIHGYFILFSNNPVSPVSPMSNNTSSSPPRYVYRKSVKDHLEDIRTITNVTVTTTGKDRQCGTQYASSYVALHVVTFPSDNSFKKTHEYSTVTV